MRNKDVINVELDNFLAYIASEMRLVLNIIEAHRCDVYIFVGFLDEKEMDDWCY